MSTRPPILTASLAAALSCLLLSPAWAEDSHDLTKLLVREPKVGEAVHEVTTELEKGRQVVRQGGKVVQDQAESKSQEYARQVEVLSADAKGNATKTRYVYRSYERAQGDSKQVLEVEGLEILVDRTKTPVRITAAKREISPFLENTLRDETVQPDIGGRLKKLKTFLPDGPVKLGATWSGDPVEVAKALAMSHKGMNVRASSVAGSLSAAKTKGRLRVQIKIELIYREYQGNPCPEPMKVQVVIEAVVSADANDPTGVMSQDLIMGGVIKTRGLLVAIDVTQSSKTEITRVKK